MRDRGASNRRESKAAAGQGAVRSGAPGTSRLAILKALGDDTRYAIYLELERSRVPLATSEIAETLGLHVNTVRPHLERMREVGLLRMHTEARGGVGRPQHRYSLAIDVSALGLEQPAYPVLARGLLMAVVNADLEREELEEAGRELGREDASRWPAGTEPIEALLTEQVRLGFDPVAIDPERCAVVEFEHCPYHALAQTNPDLVCGLHAGMVEGLVVELSGGATATRFASLVDRIPCRVELVPR